MTDIGVVDAQATTALIEFRHTGDDGKPVGSYDIRVRQGKAGSEENFIEGVPVRPGRSRGARAPWPTCSSASSSR